MGDFLDAIAVAGGSGSGTGSSAPVSTVPNSPSTHWSTSVGTIMSGLANLGTVGLGYVNAFRNGAGTEVGTDEGIYPDAPPPQSGLSTNKILLIGVAVVAVLFFVLKKN